MQDAVSAHLLRDHLEGSFDQRDGADRSSIDCIVGLKRLEVKLELGEHELDGLTLWRIRGSVDCFDMQLVHEVSHLLAAVEGYIVEHK